MPTEKQLKYWESLKGRKLSEETKKKISENNSRHFLGKKLSDEHIEKLKKKHKPMSAESRENMRIAATKRIRTKEHCLNLSKSKLGDKHHFWKGGITPENKRIRSSIEYKNWRTEVFKRDNYTCQVCETKGYKLQADHIQPFAYFPKLRFDINNGRTLCVDCHKKTDTYGGKIQTLEQYKCKLLKN